MSNTAPLVTVIIPNYNHARYLSKRIDSVLGQTVQSLEVIIMDDCSTDESRTIIDSYAQRDTRIRTLYNEQNSGSTFKQWNKGMAQARGTYIWIAESDDYADARFLETLLDKLESNPQIGLAYCMSTDVDENGVLNHITHRLGFRQLDAQLWEQDFVVEGITLVQRFMAYMCIIPNASAVVMRRSASEMVGKADETMRLSGDWWYWSCYLATTHVAFVAEPLNYFRQHTNNVRSASLVSGVAFAEETKMLVRLKQFQPDQQLYDRKISNFLPRWFYGMVNYNIPMRRHREIYQNLLVVDSNFTRRFSFEFTRFLFANRFSGIRQFVGDRLFASTSRKSTSIHS